MKKILLYALGIAIAVGVGFSGILMAQVVEQEFIFADSKIDKIEERFATTTFSSYEQEMRIKEEYKNTKEITDRLDHIIKLLSDLNA